MDFLRMAVTSILCVVGLLGLTIAWWALPVWGVVSWWWAPAIVMASVTCLIGMLWTEPQ